MADNTTTQSGTPATVPAGEVFGFDDVDGVKIARSKTGFGVDGSYTDVSAADPLPVVQTGTPALPTGAATSANQDTLIAAVDGVEGLLTTIDADTGSIAASAATIAGAVSGTEMQVDVLTMPTVAVTDNAGSLTVDDGGGSLTVDGTVAVSGTVAVTDNSGSLTVDNAGTFAVQAAQSGTWNITNVSGTVSLPTGAATAAKQPALGTAGTPSADVITVQGVTSMTALKVDGSAVTQPVSGTVTANLAAGTNNIGDVDVLSIAAGDNNIGNVDIVTVPAPLSTTGGGTEAAALRVTLASDSTGLVSVDDNGGSLTVDGTVAATQSGTWTVDLGATDNAVLDAIAASLAGTLTVTGGGGGVEYTEGDTDASITGSAIMWEDTGDTLRAVSAAKPLPVGDGGGSLTVDAASLPLPTGASTAANQTTMIGHLDGVEGLLTTIDADTGTLAGAVSGTEMQVDVVASLPAGTNAIGKLAANSGVDIGDVDVTSVIPGTGATNLGKAEDAAHSSGDTGVMALAVRKDTATQLAGTDGDYSPLITDSSGALHVNVASGSVTASGTITAELSAVDNAVLDDIAAKLGTIDTDTGNIATAVQLIDNAISGSEMQVDVVAALPAGSNTIGAVTVATSTTGGWTAMDLIDIDESEDEVKSSAGKVGGWVFTNLATSTRYVRFYNNTAAGTTVGTTAAEIVIAIPAGAGVVMPMGSVGVPFSTGICVAATTGVAASDTGAPGANEVVGTVFYT